MNSCRAFLGFIYVHTMIRAGGIERNLCAFKPKTAAISLVSARNWLCHGRDNRSVLPLYR